MKKIIEPNNEKGIDEIIDELKLNVIPSEVDYIKDINEANCEEKYIYYINSVLYYKTILELICKSYEINADSNIEPTKTFENDKFILKNYSTLLIIPDTMTSKVPRIDIITTYINKEKNIISDYINTKSNEISSSLGFNVNKYFVLSVLSPQSICKKSGEERRD